MADSVNDESVDESAEVEEKLFYAERAKTGRAKCKRCKNNIDAGSLRLAKNMPNPFGTGRMKVWHHLPCLFEAFKRQRATTPKIEKIDDIGGFETLSTDDIEEILKLLPDDARTHWEELRKDLPSDLVPAVVDSSKKTTKAKASTSSAAPLVVASNSDSGHKDNSLRQFRKICLDLSNQSSYLEKTKLLKEFFEKGSDGNSFKGNLLLWCRLLLPGAVKVIYNLQSKQLVKVFSKIFHTDLNEMLTHLEDGDVALTVSNFFQKSETVKPNPKSTLSLSDVNEYLMRLSKLTKEDDQQKLLTEVSKKCTANDLQVIIRFIKHDLRTNAGPKHILNALHPDAYEAFRTRRDIDSVINQITQKSTDKKKLNISVKLLTPVLPMLAQACPSLDAVIKKHPNGLYAEIKYDGERVQLHKQGSDFKYFSRSLKPVLPHKVNHFKDYIPKAFPGGDDLILDSEVLMIDMKTGDPLPFGSLGKYKKNEFKDASPCLFIFDCLYYNGKSLLHCPFSDRREMLQKNMIEIPNHIMFSQIKLIKKLKDLEEILMTVLNKKLEGLVLKDLEGVYEPGTRHWIKVKRDYLFGGKAADSVDLLVLGAWYGTGHKGGMMNVFLMGCYNPADNTWCSVTKVHGHDDETLQALQTQLDMVKISRDVTRVPAWLNVTRTMVPDFVARDPKSMPVWEITCHEFTKHDVHTADGISMRFPRVTKVRDDKTWKTTTTLAELQHIFEVSKTNAGSRLMPFLNAHSDDKAESETSPVKTPRKRVADSEASDVDSEKSPPAKLRKRVKDFVTSEAVSPAKKLSKIDEKEEEKTDEPRKRKKLPSQPLPDLLAGKIIKVNNSSADLEFRRHFIAYGAAVVEKSNKKSTHKVVPGSFSVTDNNAGEKMMKIQLVAT